MKPLFFNRLVKRGYPYSFILENYKKVLFSAKKSLVYSKKPKSTLIPAIFKLRYTKDTPRLGIHDMLENLHADLLIDPQSSKLPRAKQVCTSSF